ncbi:AAA family ATPase [Microvirga arabica]|uniref:AAA family ATPase n=1 Tax=Microvirga arabica TaxID=1128671 RepID=A0ABV6YAE2_9HYPH
MTYKRKNSPVPDPIVAEARRREALKRGDGETQPATASDAMPARTRAVPQPTPRPAETSKMKELSLSQRRTRRHVTALSVPSQADPGEAGSAISMIRASNLVPERLEYVWNGRIARGKLTIVAGDPGLGKSLLAARLAATVSQGSAWTPDEEQALKGSVIMVTAEDGLQDTVRPRLEAAGADLDAVHLLSGLNLTQDQDALEQEIRRLPDARLMIIDPITSCLGRTNINGAADVRAIMTSLSCFAARTGIAIVAITHLNKNGSGRAMARTVGSHAFVAVARAAYVFTKDPDDLGRLLLLPLKNNLGADKQGSAFRIEEVAISIGTAPCLVPDPEPVMVTADEALTMPRTAPGGQSILEQAKEFLCEFLAAGPVAARAVHAAATAAAIKEISLQRAKKALGVQSSKSAMDGGWQWMLPAETKMINSSEDDQHAPMSTFGADDHLRSANLAETMPSRGDHP